MLQCRYSIKLIAYMFILARILSYLPLCLLHGLSTFLSALNFYVIRYRKEVVLNNLRNAFPNKSDKERKKIAFLSMRNLFDVIVETIKAPRLSREALTKHVVINNPEIVQHYFDQQQSVLVMTMHQCNWEWLLLGCCVQFSVPIDAIYKTLHNDNANKFMYALRSRFGADPIPVKTVVRSILLRRKQCRAYALVADQAPIEKEEKIWLKCLNQDTAFILGTERLAQLTRYPVFFLEMKRIRRGYYEANFTKIAEPPYSKSDHSITKRYAELFERTVRENPQDWLWSNRRWKRKKPK